MCFNGLVVDLKGKQVNNSLLLNVILSEIKSNADGFALTGKKFLLRTLSANSYIKDVKTCKSHFVHFHLRKATSGYINYQNVHLWHIGKYYCSHNGVIKLVDRDNLSDSYIFFNEIIKDDIVKEDFDNILNKITSYTDYGVFILNNDKIAVIVNVGKDLHITFANNNLIFSNYSIDLKVNIAGYSLNLPSGRLKSGLRIIDLKTAKIIHEKLIKNTNRVYYSFDDYFNFSFNKEGL